jgi:ornithine cyclodeaminase/alanine dehydrogenase-like protein (mu-crystallin family)
MKILDAEATREALAFDGLIPAIKQMFVEGCEVPPRQTHTVTHADGATATVLIMPAWQVDGFLGVKTVNVVPANAARGLPSVFATYALFDARTGAPLAHIDGNELTPRRTAAASALAASMLARANSRRLLVVGAGRVGSVIPEAYREVLPIEEVVVWDRRVEAADGLVARLATAGIAARRATDLADAVAHADVVSCATTANEPVIHGAWLQPGTHLDLIGSFTPTMREADDDCFRGASIYVDTDEALRKSGDLLGPMSRNVFRIEDVRGTLGDLCRRGKAVRVSDSERTVFKSVGTALEDLAAGTLAYQAHFGTRQDHPGG